MFSWESKKAAKPVTAVQDCVTTFVSVKPLDSFSFFFRVFVGKKPGISRKKKTKKTKKT